MLNISQFGGKSQGAKNTHPCVFLALKFACGKFHLKHLYNGILAAIHADFKRWRFPLANAT